MLRSQLRLCAAIVFAGGVLALPTMAQSQEAQSSQSVAEAAARAKEAKKKASGKSKVLTEEDLAGKATKSGEPGPTSAQAEAGPASSTPTGGADAAKEKSGAKKEDDPEVIRVKAQLAEAEQDLDLTKREAALAQDSYYSNPDYAHDTAGKAKIDTLQQQVNDKQRTVQELKDRLAAMGVKPTSGAPAAPPSPRS
jgi:hypothetical protein